MFKRLFAVAILAGAAGALSYGTAPAPQAVQVQRTMWFEDSASQLVFFAVLEGLYTDGVSNEAVDAVLGRQMADHFVYTCPLCHPAYEAFQLYRARSPFTGFKDPKDTLGRGLDASVLKKLKSDKKAEKLEAIQALVNTWVKRRVDSQRLSKDEQARLSQRLEALRNEGMEALKRAAGPQGPHADWKGCPTCDGSAGACKKPN